MPLVARIVLGLCLGVGAVLSAVAAYFLVVAIKARIEGGNDEGAATMVGLFVFWVLPFGIAGAAFLATGYGLLWESRRTKAPNGDA